MGFRNSYSSLRGKMTVEGRKRVDKQQIGMCGAYCGICEWKEKTNCPGCQACRGDMFYGECIVAECCHGKGLLHCGLCPDIACEDLQQAFDHPEHGDCGERLANLRNWAKGDDTVIKLGTFPNEEEAGGMLNHHPA